MKTHFHHEEYSKKQALLHQQMLAVSPPPIPFKRQKKKSSSEEKDKYQTIEIPLDPSDKDSDKTEWKIPVFEEGDAEDWVKWRITYENLVEAYPLDTPDKQVKMLRTLLKGEAKDRFNTALAASKATTDTNKLNAAMNNLAKKSFNDDTNAWRRQRRYMRYHLWFSEGQFKDFKSRLIELNRYLKFFPVPENKKTVASLPDDELIEILDKAKPVQYQQALLTSNYDPYSKSMEEYSQYIERLEASAKIEKALSKNDAQAKKSAKKRKAKDSATSSTNESTKDKTCKICKRKGHTDEQCFENPKNAAKVPSWYKTAKKKKENSSKEITFTADQFNYMVNHLPMFGKKASSRIKKRKVTTEDSEEEAEKVHMLSKMQETIELRSSNESDNYSYALNRKALNRQGISLADIRRTKQQKLDHPTCEIIGEIQNKQEETVPIRVLLDTGTSSTLILQQFVTKQSSKYKTTPTKWSTLGGAFTTKQKAIINFKLPEFSNSRDITWKAHVDDTTTSSKAKYDMIIGNDLMQQLGLEISFKTKTLTWEEITIPMKDRGTITNLTEDIYHQSIQPPILKISEARHNEIIKIMYGKTNIKEYVAKQSTLNTTEQQQLGYLLSQYPNMFEGEIGTLNIPPVHFELRPGSKPYSGRPFPIPKAYETLTKEECRRFCKVGIWEHTLDSEWAAPTFIVPKKTNDVRIVTDFRELNKCIIRKPYPLPKVQDLLQKMEKFKYATAIDLRKGYYHIPLDLDI